ncbi:MAG: hypothetical protein KGK30_01790 [Elusimicrobia bacterium]|nr:hypothetical protein [Elusimicrobiota bacterium]
MIALWLAAGLLAAPGRAEAARSCTLPLFQDRELGFAVGRPAGWRLSVEDGALSLRPDRSGKTTAVVVPLRLTSSRGGGAALQAYARRLAAVFRAAGGTLRWQPKGDALALSGSFRGASVSGELGRRSQAGGTTIFGGWAPAQLWASRRRTILEVGRCYAPRRGALLSTRSETGYGPGGASTTFKFLLPEGWSVSGVTANGIDLKRDGTSGVSFAYMTGAPGVMSVDQWIMQLPLMMGYGDLRVLAERPLGSVVDPMGLRWDMKAKECEWSYQGRRFHGVLTGAVANLAGFGYGSHSGMLGVRYAPVASWQRLSAITAVVQQSIRIAGARPGQSVMLPKNNPIDSSGIMSSWELRNKVEDRESAHWRQAIMGYEEVRSPSTGQTYDAPLNAWDSTGPEGAGYYRALPNGGSERLERLNP